jgi:hypothetical protein
LPQDFYNLYVPVESHDIIYLIVIYNLLFLQII